MRGQEAGMWGQKDKSWLWMMDGGRSQDPRELRIQVGELPLLEHSSSSKETAWTEKKMIWLGEDRREDHIPQVFPSIFTIKCCTYISCQELQPHLAVVSAHLTSLSSASYCMVWVTDTESKHLHSAQQVFSAHCRKEPKTRNELPRVPHKTLI